jgi:hypothetical protein
LFAEREIMNGFMTSTEASEKWGIGVRRINKLCNEGRIEGASKLGNTWAIPEKAKKPTDQRIKSGKYVKSKENVSK